MAFSSWTSPTSMEENVPRTNSLAFAKDDCHTCQERRKQCDRQRPRCGTCIRARRQCGGFAMELTWKDSISAAPPISCDDVELGVSAIPGPRDQRTSVPNRKRALRFVQERPKAKRKPRERRSEPAAFSVTSDLDSDDPNRTSRLWDEGAGHEPVTLNPIPPFSSMTEACDTDAFDVLLAAANFSQLNYLDMDGTVSQLRDMDTASNTSPETVPSIGDGESIEDEIVGNSGEETPYEFEISSPGSRLERLALQRLDEQPGPSAFLFESAAQKFQPVLAMFDEEFCILPLSMDCGDNPFRVSRRQCEAHPFLLHSVLALSFQHLAKQRNNPALLEETDRHRSTAVQLYSQALSHSAPDLLLDTLLLLFSFEVTQSAFKEWGVHLQGAQKILSSMNIVHALRTSSRMRAQVATLVWWDTTLAFISRKECRMPSKYLDILVEANHEDAWTFISLHGCPVELLAVMGRLARLASIYEKAAKLEWTTFNTYPVDALIEDVLHFKNDDDLSISDINQDDDPNARRDRFHCVEAWRHAILLYTRRVFYTRQNNRDLRTIDHLTRVIFDHIRCIRPTVTLQKQVLLPLFLAAAELGDGDMDRDFVRTYCQHWSTTARYSQFESALSWIETIWLDWKARTRSKYWWGCKVGGDAWVSEEEIDSSIRPELLLG